MDFWSFPVTRRALLGDGEAGVLKLGAADLVKLWQSAGMRDPSSKSGQHDRTPVTTKHEKRLYANPLFAVSCRSFLGRR